jgi:hypothetical protein
MTPCGDDRTGKGCCECHAESAGSHDSANGDNYTTVIDSPNGKVRLTFDIVDGVISNAQTVPVPDDQ